MSGNPLSHTRVSSSPASENRKGSGSERPSNAIGDEETREQIRAAVRELTAAW